VVTITDPTQARWGFEASARMAADNSQAGSFTAADADTQLKTASGIQYIEHTSAGTRPGAASPVSFQFDWTAPAGSGDVIFYVAANAANGNGAPHAGDHIYTTSVRLTAVSSSQPALAAGDAVKDAASFRTVISPGSWVAIFGSNLAPTTRTWRGDEIVNGKLPTSLDGVTVMIDNKPAAISFISPGQINVQVPDDNGAGSVPVAVTTGGTTVSTSAILQPAAPGFFQYDPANRKYVAGQHADFSILAPAGLFQGATSSPAKPGEVVILYGTGFGAAGPDDRSGEVVTTPRSLDPTQLTVLIGGVQAQVQFAGVTQAGVCQLNVKVPDGLPDGDATVVAQIGGQQTQDNAFIAVQR
jgi:uncharacterized protein (TIGR03437 family)